MLRKVKLYGELAKFVGHKEFEVKAETVGKAVSFLIHNFPGIESFMSPRGNNPTCLKQDYFDAIMTNCITEKTLKENNIIPNVLINGYNAIKRDLITYMFWNKKQMQTFASSDLMITIPPGNRI